MNKRELQEYEIARTTPNYNAQPAGQPSHAVDYLPSPMVNGRINQPDIYKTRSQKMQSDPSSAITDRPAENMRRQQNAATRGTPRGSSITRDRRFATLAPDEQYEDITQQDIQRHERALLDSEAIYRVISFVSNTKYCQTPTTPTSNFEWTITRQFAANAGATILANQDALVDISAVEISAFYIPKTPITDLDVMQGTLNLRLNSVDSIDNGSSEYSGPTDSISTHRKQYTLDVEDAGQRYKLIPRNKKLIMTAPVTPSGGKWIISLSSWVRPTITFDPPIINAVWSPPASVFYSAGHGFSSATQLTPALGVTFRPNLPAYGVFVYDADSFALTYEDVEIDGVYTRILNAESSISNGTPVTFNVTAGPSTASPTPAVWYKGFGRFTTPGVHGLNTGNLVRINDYDASIPDAFGKYFPVNVINNKSFTLAGLDVSCLVSGTYDMVHPGLEFSVARRNNGVWKQGIGKFYVAEGHGMVTGDTVTIGTPIPALSPPSPGSYIVTALDTNHFTIQGTAGMTTNIYGIAATRPGTVATGGLWRRMPGVFFKKHHGLVDKAVIAIDTLGLPGKYNANMMIYRVVIDRSKGTSDAYRRDHFTIDFSADGYSELRLVDCLVSGTKLAMNSASGQLGDVEWRRDDGRVIFPTNHNLNNGDVVTVTSAAPIPIDITTTRVRVWNGITVSLIDTDMSRVRDMVELPNAITLTKSTAVFSPISWIAATPHVELADHGLFTGDVINITNPIVTSTTITKIDDGAFSIPLSMIDGTTLEFTHPGVTVTGAIWARSVGTFQAKGNKLQVGDMVTIESEIPGVTLRPSFTPFTVSSVSADSFNLVDAIGSSAFADCIKPGQSVPVSVAGRVIYINFTCYCQDKKLNHLSSNRVVLTA